MVIQEAIEDEQKIDIALNMYTFKRSSLLQSSVVAFLSRLKADDEELINLRKVFMDLNTSKTGKLSVDEIKAGTEKVKDQFKKSLGKEKSFEPDWEKLAKCITVDGNGEIGFDEFVTAASDRYRLITGEGHLKQAFDILDVDKDGEISTDELKRAFAYGNMGAGLQKEKSEGVSDAMWDELLANIDKDGDGKINFQEFSDHMLELVDKGRYDTRDHTRQELSQIS
jgi:Ca2+-binding EF-hand superfamily protein